MANRQLAVEYLDGNGNTYSSDALPAVIAANGTVTGWWSHSRTTAYAVTNGDSFAPLSADYIRPGYRIRIVANNIASGDQISKIVFGVDRLPVGPRGYPLGRVSRPVGARGAAATLRAPQA